MKFRDKLKLAYTGVGSNKFRSFLTLLGIIIGVGSVIFMVTLGSGTKTVVSGQFESVTTRQIYLSSNWNLPYNIRGKLKEEDELFLEKSTSEPIEVTPFYRRYRSVAYKGKERKATVAGIRANGLALTNLVLKYGGSLQEADIKNQNRVAVVGENILRQLVSKENYAEMLGKEISIEGNKLLIVGILGQSNSTLGLSNDSVLIPLSTYKNLWRGNSRYYDFMLIKYGKNSTENEITAQINYLLKNKYGTADGKNRFRMQGLQGRIEIVNQISTVLTYVLGGIAAISLFIGGIGVMNIMLVSVKERTKEIGIRLALGATRKQIQQQFLLEAVILTFCGGIMGIIGGSGISIAANQVINRFLSWWQGSIPLWVIILAFVVTVSIGMIFGFYPAYKASRLDPIEALKFE